MEKERQSSRKEKNKDILLQQQGAETRAGEDSGDENGAKGEGTHDENMEF